MTVFEFPQGVPTLAEIGDRLRALSREIVHDGTLDITPQDEARAKKHKVSRGAIPLRCNNVTYRLKSEVQQKRHGVTYVTISVSFDGKLMILSGNNNQLFELMRDALKALGGVEE